MKRSRFLKIVSLGAVAGSTMGGVVLKGLSALEPKPNPADQLILDSIQALMDAPPPSGDMIFHTGTEGMKAFNQAMREMAEFTKEQEYKMMYGITT